MTAELELDFAGPAMSVSGLTPIVLDDSDRAWLVASGSVQVFAAPAGAAHTQRFPLMSVTSGGLVLPPSGDPRVQLMIVGLSPGTTARPVTRGELMRRAQSGGQAAVIGLVEDWLEALSAAVSAPMPDSGESLMADEPLALSAGQPAWPATSTVWLPVSSPVRIFGDESDAVDGGILLPVPPRVWLSADTPLQATPLSSEDAFAIPDARAGVDALISVLLARLQRRLAGVPAAAADALDRRAQYEAALREQTFTALAAVLSHEQPPDGAEQGGAVLAALRLVAAAQGIELKAPPPGAIGAQTDPVDAISRASGVRWREVALTEGWQTRDVGPLMARMLDDGRPVALLPRRLRGYELVDPADGSRVRVSAELAGQLAVHGVMLYRPLPEGVVSNRQMARFLWRSIRLDTRALGLLTVGTTAVSLLTPLVTKRIFNVIVPGLRRPELVWMTLLLVVFALSSFGFAYAQQLAVLRIQGRGAGDVQAAMWDRVLGLPMPFFRTSSAGALAMSVMGVEQIRALATAVVVAAILAVPVGLGNLAEALVIDWRLGIFAVVAVAVVAVLLVVLIRAQVPRQRLVIDADDELFGVTLQIVDGIGKLRVADAERRAFAQWGWRFSRLKRRFYDAQASFAAVTALVAGAPSLGILLLLVGSSTIDRNLNPGTFLAFNTAFLQALTAVTGLTGVAAFIAQVVPLYRKMAPVLSVEPEAAEIRSDPGRLNGQIEVSHVSLRYSDDGPLVLNDVSFKIEAGEFVAFVGPSGAGKSSIMRVLLGFERPEVGSVRYDGQDLEMLDLTALRRQLGVVVQNARLLPGDIFSNIVGSRRLTLEDAWEAARTAGVDEVIQALPMGMHTIISDAGGALSGGQRQRLLIARAVAGRPRVLLFDEATSALDNRTQAAVSDAIERLHATRIVIAHRLSTVRSANRIVVLDAGKVVQVGTYDELIDVPGPFQRLARRQLA